MPQQLTNCLFFSSSLQPKFSKWCVCNANRTSLFEVRDIQFTFRQPKRHIKMAARCYHHPERLPLQRQTLVQTSAIQHTSEDHKWFKQIRFVHQDTSQSTQTTKRGTEKSWMGRDWVTEICHNQRTLTLKLTRLLSCGVRWCPISFKFSVSLVLHCW